MDYLVESNVGKNFHCEAIQKAQKIENRQAVFALPPTAQRLREMKSLLNDLRLWNLLGPDQTIQKIEKTENGYQILTHSLFLEIQIQYKQDGKRIGPAEYEFIFSEPEMFDEPTPGLNAGQALQELQAILADPRLYEILGSAQPIEKIEKTENGYLIQTDCNSIAVRVTELFEMIYDRV